MSSGTSGGRGGGGGPPRGGTGVGGLFANARATAKDRPWKSVDGPQTVVLTCDRCGAPQQPTNGLVCAYCDGHLVAPRARDGEREEGTRE